MLKNLFRQEAVEEQTNRLYGEVLVIPQITHSVVLILLSVWIIAVVAWASLHTYTKKITVLGWVEPDEGTVRVYSEGAGIVKKLLVREGESVSEGQPLIVVNGDKILESGEHLEVVLFKEYQTQKQLIADQLGRAETLRKMKEVDIENKLSAANEDLRLLGRLMDTTQQRYDAALKNFNKMKRLNELGHVASVELDRAKEQYLILLSEQQSLLRDQVSKKNLLLQLDMERQLAQSDFASSQDMLNTRLSDLAQEIAKLSGDRAHIVKAPKSGVVRNLQAREGLNTSTATPLLTILHVDASLSLNLLVPVKASGFLKEGQDVELKYDAFPYQKFGLYKASITNVSNSVFLPGEIVDVPIPVEEAVYRIKGAIASNVVKAYGKEIELKPGMTVSANIRLDSRSLLEWIFDPIYTLKGSM